MNDGTCSICDGGGPRAQVYLTRPPGKDPAGFFYHRIGPHRVLCPRRIPKAALEPPMRSPSYEGRPIVADSHLEDMPPGTSSLAVPVVLFLLALLVSSVSFLVALNRGHMLYCVAFATIFLVALLAILAGNNNRRTE